MGPFRSMSLKYLTVHLYDNTPNAFIFQFHVFISVHFYYVD